MYQNDGSTVINCTVGGNRTVTIKVNGAGSYSTDCTLSNGTFSKSSVIISSINDVITVFLDGEVEKAVTVTKAGSTSTNITDMNLYQNRVTIRTETSASAMTNTNMNQYDANTGACAGGTGDSDIGFCTDGTNLTVLDGYMLLLYDNGVVTATNYTPGGTLTTDVSTDGTDSVVDGDLTIQSGSTLTMGTNALSIGGDFTNSGTFSKSSGQTTTFTATASGFTITPGTGNFDALTLNGASGGWTMGAAGTADGNLTITAGTLTLGAFAFTASGTTSISGSLLCPAAATCAGLKTFTGALTVASGGTFDLTTSSTVATSLFSAGITQSSNVANSFKAGTGAAQLVGNLAGAGTGGINFGAGLTINSGTTSNGYTGGTTTVTGTLALTGNWTQANGSSLSLGSTTPFSGAGTFSASTPTNTVNYTATGALTVKDPDAATIHTYSNLTLSGSGAKTMTGITTANNFTMSNGATTTGNVMTTINGNVDLSSASTVFTTGAALIISGTTFVHDGSTLALGAFTFEVDGNFTVGDGATGIFTATSGTGITLKGNLVLSAGSTWTKMTSGNVTFSKGSAQTITDSTSGQNLGTVITATASTAVSTSSNIKLTSLNIVTTTSFDVSGDTITITGSGTAGSRPFVNSGTFTSTGSTMDFEGTAATDIETTNANYANLSLGVGAGRAGGVTFTLNGSVTVSGTLTVGNSGSTSADTLAITDKTLTLSGTGTPLTLAGSSKGLFSVTTGTVQYTGTSATVTATTFKNLTLGGTGTYTMPATAINISGNLIITSGATVNKAAGVVTFNAGTTQTWTDNNATAQDLGDVATATSSTAVSTSTNIKLSSLNIAGSTSFDITGDTMTITGNSTPLTVSGTFTITGSTVVYTAATATVTATTFNNLNLGTGSGTYTMPASTLTLRGNLLISATAITKGAGTVVFAKGGTQTITDNTASDLGALQVSANSGASTLNMASDIKLTSLTIDASQFFSANGSNTLTILGNTTPLSIGAGATFTPSTGTVAFVSAATTGTTVPAITYNNLTLNKASNLFTAGAGATFTVGGNLVITAGTFDLSGTNPTTTISGTTLIGGTLISTSGTLNIGGDWTNNGVFTHNSGTVAVNFSSIAQQGSISIAGSTSPQAFNNFTANTATSGKTLKFKSGSTFTVAGTLTLAGSTSNALKIAAITGTSQWILTLNGSAVVSHLTVIDSGCSGGNTISVVDSVFNLGNNGVCWLFASRGGGGVVGGGGNGGSSGGGSGQTGGGQGGAGGGSSSGGGNPVTGGTLAVDASSPVRFTGTPADNVNITSSSFTPPSNSLILALVSADAANATNITILVSDSTGLSWIQSAVMDPGHSGGNGHASVWYAVQPTAQTMTVSAKRTTSGGSSNQISVKVYVITGFTLSSPIGVTATGTSTTNNVTPTIYTSATDNSLGFVSATEWNHLGLPSSTDVYDAASYANIASLGGRKASVTTPAGTQVTFNLDAFASSAAVWNWAAVEVKSVASQGGGGGGGSP
ncbi:MAG: hypothetical protein KW804_02230 [Candidatus Doudnabacteria bacterium]|nr:hypothetical protein [Candidatus Doudnabacteria bacterium]